MKHAGNVRNALKEVYASRKYFVVTAITAFFIFAFNLLISNYKILLSSSFTFKLLYSIFLGSLGSIEILPLIFLMVTSVFAGILLSMGIYIIKRQISGAASLGSSGIAMSVIAPACPSCAIGLLSTLGFTGFLGVLPFKGLELGLFAITIIIISIIYLSGKIVTKTCKIKSQG